MKETVVKATNLKKWFPVSKGFVQSLMSTKELYVRAVDGISFKIDEGEIFGLAGESGSGKTTTGRMLLRLIEPTGGKIYFQGKEITNLEPAEVKPLRSKMQIIFQDPYESLNPRRTVFDTIAEPLRVLNLVAEEKMEDRVTRALEDVELLPPQEFFFRFPHELSGGQRQRVGVARALATNPDFIVADEPVSMLDVSIRAGILTLMLDLIQKYGMSILYITHDLALSRHMCDRIGIMYLGKMMEVASSERIVYNSLHPYTEALITAVPVPDPTSDRSEATIKGEIPSPVNPPPGCRFHTRCPKSMEICRKKEPELLEVEEDHYVACHLY